MADHKFKSKVKADGGVSLPAETVSRALEVDGSGDIKSSSVTSTELGYLSGVTSSVQTQITNAQDDIDDLVTLSGVAANATDLGTFTGTVIPDNSDIKEALQALETEVEGIPNPIYYAGTYDATGNSPDLDQAGARVQGALYRVTTGGTHDFGAFGGSITFVAGDKVAYNGSAWEKWDVSDEVISVNGQTGAVSLDTDDISEGTNKYFSDELAQDAVGTILTDSSSIDFTYDDGTPSITAVVLPAGVDHDSLQNFVANEHVDHSAVSISTAADSGLSGGGDLTSTRSLVVDINGTTAETSADNADKILIWDNSASARKSMTRANFLSGIAVSSAGDINETSFAAANNQSSAANVTGLAFANATVRSFKAQVSVAIDADSDLFEVFELMGVQKGASWDMSVQSVGDNSGITFSITTAGQVQYVSTNVAGFVSNTMKFRATTTSV